MQNVIKTALEIYWSTAQAPKKNCYIVFIYACKSF